MNQEQFEKLSNDLNKLVLLIPLNWGEIQNDKTDSQIKMFEIKDFNELEQKLERLSENSKNYFRRRWFIWKCAQCDEFLFVKNKNVKQNPNSKDQSYDIEFNSDQNLRFDLKGTVIPKSFRNNVAECLKIPKPMIQFYYDKQSSGVRNKFQNRLFIVHHNIVNPEREINLRCNFDYKNSIYEKYSQSISKNSNFIKIENVISDVIFIIENNEGILTYKIHSLS